MLKPKNQSLKSRNLSFQTILEMQSLTKVNQDFSKSKNRGILRKIQIQIARSPKSRLLRLKKP